MSSTKPPHKFPLLGPNLTTWSPSDTSQASYPGMPFPTVVPAYPLPVFPSAGTMPQGPEASVSGLNESQESGNQGDLPLSQFPAPLVTPVVALVLPNYVYSRMNNGISQALYPDPPNLSAQPSFSSQALFTAQPPFAALNAFPPQTVFPEGPFHYNPSAESEKSPVAESRNEPSRSCTPQSLSRQDQASPPLFQSRCSSPLQLNLLQLEDMPKMTENGTPGTLEKHGTLTDGESAGKPLGSEDCNKKASFHVSILKDFLEDICAEEFIYLCCINYITIELVSSMKLFSIRLSTVFGKGDLSSDKKQLKSCCLG